MSEEGGEGREKGELRMGGKKREKREGFGRKGERPGRWRGGGKEKGIKWEEEVRGAAFQLQGIAMNCLRFGASAHLFWGPRPS